MMPTMADGHESMKLEPCNGGNEVEPDLGLNPQRLDDKWVEPAHEAIGATSWTMTNISKIVALTLLSFLLANQYAQAAEAKIITFACDGRIKITTPSVSNSTPEPINKLNLVVNFRKNTVSFAGIIAQIDTVDAANIYFSGENKTKRQHHSLLPISVLGHIDRITGAVQATSYSPMITSSWEMFCKQTKRLGSSKLWGP
jgi:hypothetical protein